MRGSQHQILTPRGYFRCWLVCLCPQEWLVAFVVRAVELFPLEIQLHSIPVKESKQRSYRDSDMGGIILWEVSGKEMNRTFGPAALKPCV